MLANAKLGIKSGRNNQDVIAALKRRRKMMDAQETNADRKRKRDEKKEAEKNSMFQNKR